MADGPFLSRAASTRSADMFHALYEPGQAHSPHRQGSPTAAGLGRGQQPQRPMNSERLTSSAGRRFVCICLLAVR